MITQDRRVQLSHDLRGALVAAADHDAVRAHEIVDRRAFLEELRVGNHAERQLHAAVLQFFFDHGTNPFCGAHRHRRLVHHHAVAAHVPADAAGGAEHVAQIRRAILVGRRAHGDHLHGAVRDAFLYIGGEAQSTCSGVVSDQLLQSRLVDRNAAGVERRDFLLVEVETDHFVAKIGKTGARYQPHVSAADDGDLHFPFSSVATSELMRASTSSGCAARVTGRPMTG